MNTTEDALVARINRAAETLRAARLANQGSGQSLAPGQLKQLEDELTSLQAQLRRERARIGVVR